MKPDFYLRYGRHGLISILIGLGMLIAEPAALAQGPSWWTNRLVITNRTASDYSPANQGQAKCMATNAYLEFLYWVPGSGNSNIMNVVTNFTTNGNYLPINLGQIKALARPFYDRIQQVWTNSPYITNARPIGVTNTYPWTTTTNDDSSYAIANVGQLKYAFSFGFDRVDSDGDNLPDAWELAYFGNLSQTGTGSYLGDGISNYQKWLEGRNPKVGIISDTNGLAGLKLYTPLK